MQGLCKDTGFLETVHSFSDFEINITFGVKAVVGGSIFVKDFLRNIFAVDAHVLENLHVGDQKKVFEISSAVACSMLLCI
jgi:hypothetical protein